jgi:transglutaminase-like putative cysteine protease
LSIHVALNHVTQYRYDRRVGLGPQVVRLRPAPHSRTRILSYSMKVTPARHFVNWQQDPQSNYLARLVFPEKTEELRIEVDLVAEMAVLNPFDFFLEPYATRYPFRYEEIEHRELAPFLATQPLTPRLADYLESISRKETSTVDFLVELNSRLSRDIRYLIRLEPGVQTPEETLLKASGSCRDSGWLLVQLLRHLGLAARFVSGYLIQLVADVKSLDGPSGPPQDFTDLHAWCEVYLPGAGWIGLDPTSGLLAGEGHIPLAATPEPTSAAPITGEVEESNVDFSHSMSVTRVWEAPRVTKPYTEEQWRQIDALGREIDADLEALDVRLTMGGEPTFVSLDDPDGPEWNTAALGSTKRLLAANLYRRLKEKYAPQGLAHFGQGKWYPGEPLPRWSLNCFWRRDGQPIWQNPELIADESIKRDIDATVAQRFLATVAMSLGLSPAFVFAAYEDAFYYLWRERRLPANVEPGRPRRARASCARVRPGARVARRVRVPDRQIRGRAALGNGAVVSSPRALLPDPGRFSSGLPVAARFDAVGCARGLSIRAFTGSFAGLPAAAEACGNPPAASRRRSVAHRGRNSGGCIPCARTRAGGEGVGALDHAHGDDGGATRWRALHLHAAGPAS